jgi:hypothetical protein
LEARTAAQITISSGAAREFMASLSWTAKKLISISLVVDQLGNWRSAVAVSLRIKISDLFGTTRVDNPQH